MFHQRYLQNLSLAGKISSAKNSKIKTDYFVADVGDLMKITTNTINNIRFVERLMKHGLITKNGSPSTCTPQLQIGSPCSMG